MGEFKHYSVMLSETIEGIAVKPDGIYVDGTLGGAGHSSVIASKLTTGRLIGIDQDGDAIEAAAERLEPYKERDGTAALRFFLLQHLQTHSGTRAAGFRTVQTPLHCGVCSRRYSRASRTTPSSQRSRLSTRTLRSLQLTQQAE